MSKKSFQSVPKPKMLTDDALESFEKAGPGHGPALEEPPRRNVKQEKTTEPTKRLSVDVPVSVHRRFKTACSATNRQMVAELRHLIEAHILELESEIGSVGQDDLR